MAKHSTRSPKPRAVIGTPWFIRLAVYVVVAITGLALTVAGIVTPEMVDGWLGQTGSLAALIGGLLAAVNTGRESDEKPVGFVPDLEVENLDHSAEQGPGQPFSVFVKE